MEMHTALSTQYTLQNNKNKKIFTIKEIATIGMMAAMLEVVKIALQSIPNVELVTLLIILFSLYLGPKSLIAVWAFVGMECVHWGIGLWTIMYFYIWPILVIATLIKKKYNTSQSKWPYVILSTIYGLLFGALCSIPYLFIGGLKTAITWWISGIPYDVIHGVSNGVICFVLFSPLHKIMKKI